MATTDASLTCANTYQEERSSREATPYACRHTRDDGSQELADSGMINEPHPNQAGGCCKRRTDQSKRRMLVRLAPMQDAPPCRPKHMHEDDQISLASFSPQKNNTTFVRHFSPEHATGFPSILPSSAIRRRTSLVAVSERRGWQMTIATPLVQVSNLHVGTGRVRDAIAIEVKRYHRRRQGRSEASKKLL